VGGEAAHGSWAATRPSPLLPERRSEKNEGMASTLVIGYGNLDRQDDGVAYEVVNALRQRLGQAALGEEETGLEDLGTRVDSVFVTQLGTELLEVAAPYDRLVFVDAHVRTDMEPLHCQPVEAEYTTATFTHHMTPALFIALLQALHRCEPVASIVSIRGQSFDFRRGVTPEAARWIQPAVDQLVQLSKTE
jgi:hydrogenase maturation protease